MLPIDFSEIPSPLCWHFSYILSSQLLSQFFKCAFFKLLFSNFFMAVQWNLDLLSFLGVFLDVSFGSLSCWRAHDLQQRCSFVTLFCCTPKKRRKISRFSGLTFRFKAEPKATKWTWNINQLPLRSPDGSVIFKRDVHVIYQRILACSLCFGNFQSASLSAVGRSWVSYRFWRRPRPRTLQHHRPSTSTSRVVDTGNIKVCGDGLVALRLSVLVYDLLSDIYKLFSAFFPFSALCYAQLHNTAKWVLWSIQTGWMIDYEGN